MSHSTIQDAQSKEGRANNNEKLCVKPLEHTNSNYPNSVPCKKVYSHALHGSQNAKREVSRGEGGHAILRLVGGQGRTWAVGSVRVKGTRVKSILIPP